MADYTPQPGSFSLFKNDKGDNEKRPDYTGEGLDVDGNPIKVSAWLRVSAKGTKFMSCRMEAKTETKAKGKPDTKQVDDDNDLPF